MVIEDEFSAMMEEGVICAYCGDEGDRSIFIDKKEECICDTCYKELYGDVL